MTEDLKKLVDAADPNKDWRYIEADLGPDGEWFGCGVERNGSDEFIWDDFDAETAVPTNRLIAMAPDLARRVIAAEALVEALITIRDKRSQCNRAADCQHVARKALAAHEEACNDQ